MCLTIAKPVNLSEVERGLLTTLPGAERAVCDALRIGKVVYSKEKEA